MCCSGSHCVVKPLSLSKCEKLSHGHKTGSEGENDFPLQHIDLLVPPKSATLFFIKLHLIYLILK